MNVNLKEGNLKSGASLVDDKPDILAGILLPQTPTNGTEEWISIIVDDWTKTDRAIDFFARHLVEVLADHP